MLALRAAALFSLVACLATSMGPSLAHALEPGRILWMVDPGGDTSRQVESWHLPEFSAIEVYVVVVPPSTGLRELRFTAAASDTSSFEGLHLVEMVTMPGYVDLDSTAWGFRIVREGGCAFGPEPLAVVRARAFWIRRPGVLFLQGGVFDGPVATSCEEGIPIPIWRAGYPGLAWNSPPGSLDIGDPGPPILGVETSLTMREKVEEDILVPGTLAEIPVRGSYGHVMNLLWKSLGCESELSAVTGSRFVVRWNPRQLRLVDVLPPLRLPNAKLSYEVLSDSTARIESLRDEAGSDQFNYLTPFMARLIVDVAETEGISALEFSEFGWRILYPQQPPQVVEWCVEDWPTRPGGRLWITDQPKLRRNGMGPMPTLADLLDLHRLITAPRALRFDELAWGDINGDFGITIEDLRMASQLIAARGPVPITGNGVHGWAGLDWSWDFTVGVCAAADIAFQLPANTPVLSAVTISEGVIRAMRDEDGHLRVVLSGATEAERSFRLWFEGSAPPDPPRLTGAIGVDALGMPIQVPVAASVIVVPAPSAPIQNALKVVPNPFNPRTSIEIDVPVSSALDVSVFDVAGRRVRDIVRRQSAPAGRTMIPWDGRDGTGRRLASGVYFLRARIGNEVLIQKVSLLK